MLTGNGWEQKNRILFDSVVEEYDYIRPDYPDEIFRDIFKYCGITTDKPGALEIGAGTGKATKPVLDAGFQVTAVELGENMSACLRKRYADQNGFSVICSTFEDAVLPENQYNLIYAASAFHWVTPETGCPKVFQLLKKNGVFALFRYNNVPEDGNEVYEEMQKLYRDYYNCVYSTVGRPEKISVECLKQPSSLEKRFGFSDLCDYGFRDIQMFFYEADKVFTADEYIMLLDTFSDHRNLPEQNRKNLYQGIHQIIMNHGNSHVMHYIYQLYMGRK